MNTRKIYLTACVPIVLAAGFLGCATKNYVKAQVAPLHPQMAALDTKTTQLAEQEQRDVSRLNERIITVDNKATEAGTTAQQASASAARGYELGQRNQAAITENQSAISAANASISNLDKSLSYKLATTSDVTFDFAKYSLGKLDKAALDSVIQHSQSMPRSQIELIGFTDRRGSNSYNLALSRRRSEAVARYLVSHGVPLKNISIIGMGEEAVPAVLLQDVQAVDPNVTKADAHRLARRVLIRVYSPQGNLQSASLQ